ncbi:HAD-IC family P-type ATPase [Enterococcus sp. BWT-B8]|uniref:HAD-IC family P-type ATPase n=1 Tax=Enterococcus sp. BWT-B8 TaxID=2885157 RepID=UPI001E515DBF|nr:HAD-IC family P-type ATPase [Enterococcus sp. BWT-B8]MCB5953186.1 HAD-IC family P-type ATPase [Enterococcus sp. BWT-B8]
MKWYQMDMTALSKVLDTSEIGLSQEVRKKRLEQDGKNILTGEKEDGKLKKFFAHFHDLLIYVLIASAVLKGLSGDFIDMTIILFVVLINSIIGYVQEAKATDSLKSLNDMMSTSAVILSDGEKQVTDAETLVKGDVVCLNPGDIIPADLRVFAAYNLVVEEAILTGESTPVEKHSKMITENVELGDCTNMVFSGTLVTSGSGKGVVVSVADDTEIGKISQHLKSIDNSETPLIKKMKILNKQIFYTLAALITGLTVFSIFFRDFTGSKLLSSMIALAVSAVPEGLPAVLSIILSVGVARMAQKKAIIKKMPAVETLGSMGIICSDKTGTLTKNEMQVVSIVTVDGTEKSSQIEPEMYQKELTQAEEDDVLRKLIEVARYCNDTKITYKNGQREVIGNPTEGALLEWANHLSIIEEEHDISKIPFDSSYKYMATLVEVDHRRFIYLKGAPDILLRMVEFQLHKDGRQPFNETYWQEKIQAQAQKGQRVLAAAFKEVPQEKESLSHQDLKDEMILIGLYGIIDPPKPEAIEAVAVSKKAGISVKMITGDHKDTAIAIAKQIGLEQYDHALEGKDIEQLSDDELAEIVLKNDVYARTTPEHKLRLVHAIQKNGYIVGMTGDGVNDAPALKQADIGIAMGIKGTQVTKDAADMVLADDNFATITSAVKEGRRVYDNLKKTIYFSLPTAFAQGLLVVLSILLDRPLPLTSVQILWLNMVTTITLSFALGFEPLGRGRMAAPPRDPEKNILDRYAVFRIIYVSILLAALGFFVNDFLATREASVAVMQTTLIMTIVFGQVFYMINCREITDFSINAQILTNKVLWLSLLVLFILQSLLIYAPFMHTILGTAAIDLNHIGLSLTAGIILFVFVELEKTITRSL